MGPPLQMGPCELGVNENNEVMNNFCTTITSNVVVMKNGWRYVLVAVNAWWNVALVDWIMGYVLVDIAGPHDSDNR